ncbi:MAG TPA: hypothetical protein VNJ47_07050 [Nevskiales bacterium]|nr:hypothetical protein [Nevskiales bacterium]
MKPRFPFRRLVLCAVLAGVLAPAQAEETLILPQPALLRAQKLLRQAELDGAAAMQPGAVLIVQEKINAAWSAYHRQVEEEADDPEDDEAVLARQLADEAELDAELLQVSLRTQAEEARLDGLRASRGLPPAERLNVPAPAAPPAEVRR